MELIMTTLIGMMAGWILKGNQSGINHGERLPIRRNLPNHYWNLSNDYDYSLVNDRFYQKQTNSLDRILFTALFLLIMILLLV